jgi:PAS domain S-box-containing protein
MAKAQILVVEDDNIVVMELQDRLQSLGYAVVAVASCGEEAIRKAGETHPDLVLMDIRLKGEMDGVEAAEEIRDRFNIPVVYLTALADEGTLQRAKVAEPYGYIIKPFDERELRTSIVVALHRHKLEAALRESERHYRLLAENVSDVIWTMDMNLQLTCISPSVSRLRGYNVEEAMAQTMEERLTPASFEVATKAFAGALVVDSMERGGLSGSQTLELEFTCKDGSTVWTEVKVTLLRDSNGQPTGILGVTRDITERKRAEEALRQYTVELEARNEELDAFAHTVAHNLKGPLAPLIGIAEVLEVDYASLPGQKLQEYLCMISQFGHKMGRIIDELLLLAEVHRMEELTMEPLNIARTVAEAQGRVAYLIEEHQAEIISPGTWPVALGYGPWVEEVWANYLSNAIQYGGRPPRVELGVTEQADGMVRFWVRDNGPGLTPEEQARLFTPFTQLAQVRARGHGLGLSIVRRIVERLGGQVGVESEIGQGSVFTFTLPGVGS